MLTKKIGFSEKSRTIATSVVLTQEDFSSMMKLEEYLTEMLMPIYPAELEKHRNNFFMLFINVMSMGAEGLRLTTTDLQADISRKLPTTAKNYIFVYDELNDNVPLHSTADEEAHKTMGRPTDPIVWPQSPLSSER